MRKLENEIKRTEEIVGADHHLVASARDVVATGEG
jgi:hypothetical protein